MENNILLDNGEFPGQGPAQHLRFILAETNIPIGEGEAVSQQSVFFSLHHAFCKLLAGNLENVELRLARQKGLTHYGSRSITSVNDGTLYGKIVGILPGNDQLAAPPGIYLQSDFSADELRQMTGIPFPSTQKMDSDFLIPLRTYNEDFTDTSPNVYFESIQEHVRQFLNAAQTADAGLDYHLTFKGAFMQASSAGEHLYVQRHYFDNLFEPVKKLLSTDPLLFDDKCADNEYEIVHHYAYINRPGTQELISINVMPINDALDGMPTAGIYLHMEEDIQNLERDTGIGLHNAHFYDEGLPFLLLAEYVYNRGLRLVPDEGIVELARNLQDQHYNGKQQPNSPYVLTVAYDFNLETAAKPAVSTAWDKYHYQLLEQAIFKLVTTDLHLFGDPRHRVDAPYSITSAEICDSQQRPMASLQLAPANVEGHAQMHLVIEGAMADLAPAIYQAMTLLFTGHLDVQRPPMALHIPVAHYNREGQYLPHPVNQQEILTFLSSAMTERISRKIASDHSPISTTSAGGSYHINLEWSEPAPPTNASTTSIHQPDLDVAHRYLQQMHPQLFLHTNPGGPQRYIVRASLVDSDTDQPIVSRFYHPASDPVLAAGFYLQYHLDHPASSQLKPAADGHTKMMEAASSIHLATYAQPVILPVHLQATHPRTLMDNEGRDTGPGIKL
ncbi:hypothetical protein HB364_13835 [Pseudoflavitalea sp. X16]|uniref:hypothetical protein n=1 Tax=Paraflavitalea devenefica TaxID=2716334 RepID=UPI0014229E1D|nr:hypothetical protein [Paraflavitalea devenefica]NII26169.1 hypothetical protein [Paraflavitalea devenefica]